MVWVLNSNGDIMVVLVDVFSVGIELLVMFYCSLDDCIYVGDD